MAIQSGVVPSRGCVGPVLENSPFILSVTYPPLPARPPIGVDAAAIRTRPRWSLSAIRRLSDRNAGQRYCLWRAGTHRADPHRQPGKPCAAAIHRRTPWSRDTGSYLASAHDDFAPLRHRPSGGDPRRPEQTGDSCSTVGGGSMENSVRTVFRLRLDDLAWRLRVTCATIVVRSSSLPLHCCIYHRSDRRGGSRRTTAY